MELPFPLARISLADRENNSAIQEDINPVYEEHHAHGTQQAQLFRRGGHDMKPQAQRAEFILDYSCQGTLWT